VSNIVSHGHTPVHAKFVAAPARDGIGQAAQAEEPAKKAEQIPQFRTLFNDARALQGQPAVAAAAFPATQAGMVDLLFQERAYGLYLTGHRLSDMRRLIRQYGRTPDTIFPTGEAHDRSQYGDYISSPFRTLS
jgi:hypothetical protein